jgi:hypothetical protein
MVNICGHGFVRHCQNRLFQKLILGTFGCISVEITIGPNYTQVSSSVPNFHMLIILEMVLPGSSTLPALNMVKYYG